MSDHEGGRILGEPRPPPLSKNQMKKLKRDEQWEAGREARKAKRKEKIKVKKQQKRAARETHPAASSLPIPEINSDAEQATTTASRTTNIRQRRIRTLLPVTFVVDCGFEDLMNTVEHKSLTSQITRSYSENRKARYQAHLVISSFNGHLKDRFNGVLEGQYLSWKDTHFINEDFVQAKELARSWTRHRPSNLEISASYELTEETNKDSDEQTDEEMVYLTSDSPNTLTELKPRGIYIIGGLVDRNRHKGVCYKRAMDRQVKTAKLPIGEYMEMNSRHILTTNQVLEIMLKWLEFKDWSQAFMGVIPKRKGGTLREADASGEAEIDDPGDVAAEHVSEAPVDGQIGEEDAEGVTQDETRGAENAGESTNQSSTLK